MYFPRRLYLCQNGHKFKWSSSEQGIVNFPDPICPLCYYNFITLHIPIGKEIPDEPEITKIEAGIYD